MFHRTRERTREREVDEEDEEEVYERRKLERKLREKESAYQEVPKLLNFITELDNLIRYEEIRWNNKIHSI